MARFHCHALHLFACIFFLIFTFAFTTPSKDLDREYSVTNFDWELFQQDYSPPAPPPPPPRPPSVSCVDDLDGVGSLDTTCQIVSDLKLTRDVYIAGRGSFYILPEVKFQCMSPGCIISVDVGGNFSLGNNSSIIAGTFWLVADNVSFGNDSVVNTTAMAGDPPPQTSGTPQGLDGAGGGHGGRGACCLKDKTKLPEDVWGGDAYSWSSAQKPLSYGSKGGSTCKEHDYGGLGGGIVYLVIKQFLQVNGSVLADGGNGGEQGGGGSGGSICIHAHKM